MLRVPRPRVFRVVGMALLSALLACSLACDGDRGPITPTLPIQRLIVITGLLNFTDVQVGSSSDRVITITNAGVTELNITGISLESAGNFTLSWTSGTIPPSQSQAVTVRFTPTEIRKYDTRLRFNGNHTSGDNTVFVLASGVSSDSTDSTGYWDY